MAAVGTLSCPGCLQALPVSLRMVGKDDPDAFALYHDTGERCAWVQVYIEPQILQKHVECYGYGARQN